MASNEDPRGDTGTLPLREKPIEKDRFGQLGVIGEGGQAVVRRVRDFKLERDLAMKVMKPVPRERAAADDVSRFVDEARITAQLDHPHVPPVHDLGVDDEGAHYFTMKLVEGKTLAALLGAATFSSSNDEALFKVLQILIKVCEAVSFAHSRGVIHCDLKPSNVMVGSHGQVYVMDWGISRRMRRGPGPIDDRILGSIGYMSPEQARGDNDKLDARTDVYALGAILYRIVVGFPPYHAQSADESLELAKGGAIFPPEEQAQGRPLSRRLLEIAFRALSRDPKARHPNVDALQWDLESYLRGSARFPERTFEPGEVVMREGEPADCAYVILKGQLEATRMVNGFEKRLRVMGPGELFGESAILAGQPRTATVIAIETTRVSVLSRGFLAEEMGRADVVSLALNSVLARFHDLERDGT